MWHEFAAVHAWRPASVPPYGKVPVFPVIVAVFEVL
jgi:hypothetical protein